MEDQPTPEQYLRIYADLNEAFFKEVQSGATLEELEPLIKEMNTIWNKLKTLPKSAIVRHMNGGEDNSKQAAQ